ncbi:MAG: sigma 54-interacting transcriptional regulator [Clostridiales Family XIII bacterium]|jgi:transcriptional regulator with PAS, ATPase and Fis domain|nr:sigma 54-interacting transcriptional regulator [Clostridiales Family XIII bacterium]
MPKRTALLDDFALTPEECEGIIRAIPGLVVVDGDGRIRYIDESVVEEVENLRILDSPDCYVGKMIDEVHPTSKVMEVIRRGKAEKAAFYFEGGDTSVTHIIPIYRNGELANVIDFDIFENDEEIKAFVRKVFEFEKQGLLHLSDREPESPDADGSMKYTVSDIIGNSEKIRALKQQIFNVAEGNSTILINGETGSGKELVAHAIHSLSARKHAPFIEVNCAAIPEPLFESELFGYEGGSFTGAASGGKSGKFMMADKGTIFLDEIDQIPYHIQPKLFRVLQESEIDRIGSKPIPIDVRIIATTNKNLKQLVNNNQFREDMYYRLNVVSIDVPPLRERREDIPLIAQTLLKQLNSKLNRNTASIADETYRLFEQYHWPGNVRELANVLERAMNNCKDESLKPAHLGKFLADIMRGSPADADTGSVHTLSDILAATERSAIERALRVNDGNKTKAAELLAITRPSLYYKMKKYGIQED